MSKKSKKTKRSFKHFYEDLNENIDRRDFSYKRERFDYKNYISEKYTDEKKC